MDRFSITQKIRPKSSLKFSIRNFSGKKEKNEESFSEITKNQSYKRIYNNFSEAKRFKSYLNSTLTFTTTLFPATPTNKIPKNESLFIKKDQKVKIFHEKKIDKGKIQYEIIKAKSDKLEVVRDLSTYDFNFIVFSEIEEKCKEMKKFTEKISVFITKQEQIKSTALHFHKYLKNNLITDTKRNSPSQINYDFPKIKEINSEKTDTNIFFESENNKKNENYSKVIESFDYSPPDPQIFNVPFKNYEDFRIKNSTRFVIETNFFGISTFSSEKCLINIRSKQYFTHYIKCFTLSNEKLSLKLQKNLMSEYENKKNNESIIKAFILPYLYLIKSINTQILCYDENYGITFIAHTTYVKGIKKKITLIIKNLDDSFQIELARSKTFIIIFKFLLQVEDFSNTSQEKLKKYLKNHLIYYKNTLNIVNDPFELKQNFSKIENHLSGNFNEKFRKIFNIKVIIIEKTYLVEGFESKKQRYLKISYANSSTVVEDHSNEYKLIFSLQSIDFYRNKLTLCKSLELEYILKKLFSYIL